MLTADLLRASVRGGVVRPSYLPRSGRGAEGWVERATELVALFEAHRGRTRGELTQALQDRTAGSPDFKVERGLAKLLEDRGDFEGRSHEEAARWRDVLFRRAAAARVGAGFARDAGPDSWR